MAEAADQRFAPPMAHVEDVRVQGGDVLAGRGMRLAAKLVDTIILGVLYALVMRSAVLGHILTSADNDGMTSFKLSGFIVPMSLMLLVNGWLLFTRGQTLGKMLCSLRIVRSDGSKADAWRVFGLRYGIGCLFNTIALASVIFWFIDSLLIFRAARKCLHDLIADTKVIKL